MKIISDPIWKSILQKGKLSNADQDYIRKLLDDEYDVVTEIKENLLEFIYQSAESKTKTMLDGYICLQKYFDHLQKKSLEGAFFSPGDSCLCCVISFIRRAKKTLDICVFTITDNRIASEIQKAHSKSVIVRIITDNEKMEDAGSDVRELASYGIPVVIDQTSDHMHHKFAICDQRFLLTGSYNWTRNASMQNENVVILQNPTILQSFQEEFERLWKIYTPLTVK